VPLQKGNIFAKDWLLAAPNPFKEYLTVHLKAPETGEVSLRLVDSKGSVVETVNATVTRNEAKTIRFSNRQKLQDGVYFLEYISKTQRRIISLLKG
jgi:methionine-rich copper-binding protein CopC